MSEEAVPTEAIKSGGESFGRGLDKTKAISGVRARKHISMGVRNRIHRAAQKHAGLMDPTGRLDQEGRFFSSHHLYKHHDIGA